MHRKQNLLTTSALYVAGLTGGQAIAQQPVMPPPVIATQAPANNTQLPSVPAPVTSNTTSIDGVPDKPHLNIHLYARPGQYGEGFGVGERNLFHDMLDAQGTVRFASKNDAVDGGAVVYAHPLNLKTHTANTKVGKLSVAGSAGVEGSFNYTNGALNDDIRALAKGVQTIGDIPHFTDRIKVKGLSFLPGEFRLSEKASVGTLGPYVNGRVSAVVLSSRYAKGLVNYNERKGIGFDVANDSPRGWSATFEATEETNRKLKALKDKALSSFHRH